MFSLSALVGTPRASRLEFTPIGKRKTEQPEVQQHQRMQEQRMALNSEKIHNSRVESTFEDTTDFGSLHSLGSPQQEPPRKSPALFDGMFRPRDKIVSESSSIQELQAEVKDLSAENYNLKIEVATLTKFLKQTPQEHHDLVYENVELKQQLMRITQELQSARALQGNQASVGEEAAIRAMKALYRETIDEKDRELRKLETKLQEQDSRPQIPDLILDKVEFLQTENQSLRRRLEDQALFEQTHTSDTLALLRDNNELKAQIQNLQQKYTHLPSDAADQLSRMEAECDSLQRKVRSVEQELELTERENENLQIALKSARFNADSKANELDQLQQEVDALRSRNHASASLIEIRLDEARQEATALKATVKRLEFQLSNEVEEKQAEIQRYSLKLSTLQKELKEQDKSDYNREAAVLKATVKRLEFQLSSEAEDKQLEITRLALKLASLQQELKEKDKDEYNLRSQVRSLMDERKSAFNSESTVKHYQTQIDSLRNRELSLSDKNRELKEEIAKLQDELYSVNTQSSKAAKLREETQQLQDKLDFYEKEYALIQDALDNAESEVESFKSKEKRTQLEIRELESEIEELRSRLRNSEIAESQKFNESALYELESVHKKREIAERQRMDLQIEALNFQIRKLERELETARATSHSVLDDEYHRVMKERSKLQIELDDKDLKLRENQTRHSKLESVIKDKEAVIDALESRIRELNRDYKSNMFAEDNNKSEIYKVKTEYEYQIRALQLENDRIQRDVEDQIRFYKTKLDLIMERERHGPVISNSVPSSIVALLESQLEDARSLNRELSDKLANNQTLLFDTERSQHTFKMKIQELEGNYSKVKEEKIRLEEMVDTLETDSKILRSEKNRIESRAKNLAQELSRTSRHCTKLASKINEMDLLEYKNSYKSVDEALKAKKLNAQLQIQIDQLNSKLAVARISAPLPVKNSGRENAETRLLRNELQFYKAKLFDLNLRANDLSLMNNFVMSSIRNSNQMIKNDIVKLAQCGVYPDYAEMDRRGRPKLTLKVLATFVLSMVRIKRRCEKAQNRNVKLLQLRGDIDRDKITLMAE